MEVSTICMLRKTGIRCMIPDDGRYYEPCTSCFEGCLYEDEDDKNSNPIYSAIACLNKVYKTFNYVRYCKTHYYKMKAIFKEKARAKADYIKENYVFCGFHMEKYDWKEELKVLHFISKTKLNKHKITSILENDELKNDNNDNNDNIYDEYDLDVWPMDKHYKYLKNDIQHNYRYMSTSNNIDDDTSSDDISNKKTNLKDSDELIIENIN
jgi:hypothetical protein